MRKPLKKIIKNLWKNRNRISTVAFSLVLTVFSAFYFPNPAYALTWSQSNTDGFGDSGNTVVYSLAAYGGNLYAGTFNYSGAEVWEYDGASWTQVNSDGFGDANNKGVNSLAAYGGNLYAGTNNDTTGAEVWEYDGASWTQANSDGFGDVDNGEVRSLTAYGGNLYAGTVNGAT